MRVIGTFAELHQVVVSREVGENAEWVSVFDHDSESIMNCEVYYTGQLIRALHPNTRKIARGLIGVLRDQAIKENGAKADNYLRDLTQSDLETFEDEFDNFLLAWADSRGLDPDWHEVINVKKVEQ